MSKKTTNKNDELAALTEDLQRAQADLINYRQRVEREKAELLDYAKSQIVRELLPLIDNLERALTHIPKDLEKNDWAKGVANVGKQVSEAFNNLGVVRIPTIGEIFDPHLHEAVSADGEGEVERISEELQSGYMLGDDVIRPAVVKVRRDINQ